MAACGKKGPPLPPLIKLPAAPDGFTAVRRGDTVQLQFTVPSTNTDRTRPANVERVEIYALTGAAPANDVDLLKRAAKVASVAVKAPRDPNQTTDVDELPEEAEEVEPPEGPGLDQGAAARVEERLSAASLVPPSQPTEQKETNAGPHPLVGPSITTVPSRTYIGVGINKSGRKGPLSKRVAVPLVPPPPAPTMLNVTYDESAVTLAWSPPALGDGAPAAANEVPSRPIGLSAPKRYNVYEVAPGSPGSGTLPPETQLTKTPTNDARFADQRISWGATRCYAVRTVESFDNLMIESDPTRPECVTFKDTFPPAAPQGLTAVASEGAISLIWEPSNEKDLEGYLVLRGAAPGGNLQPITPAVIHETTFHDAVPPGAHYVYAIEAVDKAGNISRPSTAVDETAR
jgi:hypothetical protein